MIILGLLGAWRYGWGAVHLARALIYRHLVFPAWRRAADERGAAGARLAGLYRHHQLPDPRETTAGSTRRRSPRRSATADPVTIIAGIVELADQRVIKQLFQRMNPPAEVRLMFVRRPGTGKRHSMACALARDLPRAARPRTPPWWCSTATPC